MFGGNIDKRVLNPIREPLTALQVKNSKRTKAISYKVQLEVAKVSPNYQVFCKDSKGRLIAKHLNNGYLVVVDNELNWIQTLNSQGLFWLSSSALLLNSGTLLVYNNNTGRVYRSTDTTYTTFEVVYEFRANTQILTDRGWDSDGVRVMFGEYSTNSPRTNPDTQRVIIGTNDGRTWATVVEFNRNPQFEGDTDYIRHIHTTCYDKYSNKFWIGTGDGGEEKINKDNPMQLENRIMTINPDGTGLKLISNGSQGTRVVGIEFSDRYVFWGCDGLLWEGDTMYRSFFRYDRETGETIETTRIGNHVFGTFSIDYNGTELFCGCTSSSTVPRIYVTKNADKWLIGTELVGRNMYSRIDSIVSVGGNRIFASGQGLTFNGTDYIVVGVAIRGIS